jgi:class 3 adenylate cyclase
MNLCQLLFFSLQKKLLALVISSIGISILITTALFLNFDDIPLLQLEENIIVIAITLMIGLGTMTYFLSKRLSEPITKLSDAANVISQGDFSVRTNITSRDEIGQLSSSFDLMAQKLEESLNEIIEKEKIINELNGDKILKFSQHIQNDCVGVIDMTDSTMISSELSHKDVTKMYEIFLNFMAKIIHDHDGEVIKNIGDALLFRFSKVNSNDSAKFKNIIECCLLMTESHDELKKLFQKENLSELDYRISLTYGSVIVAHSITSNMSDVFGSTVNRCFKINCRCPQNTLVIDADLYAILKNFNQYKFTKLIDTEIKEKYDYAIFEVKRKN